MPDQISFIEHPSDIVAHAAYLIQHGRRFALISSVAIEGGAAREVGSLALVEETGAMVGYLSNGCIDKDIQFHALDALSSGGPKLIRYGEGSRYADLQLPCGGALSVLIDPTPDLAAIQSAHDSFLARETASLTHKMPAGEGPSLTFSYSPKFRLVLAGRGAVFRAMAEVTKSAGFQLQVLSPDEDDLAATRDLSDVAPVHLTSPNQAVKLEALDEHSAFLTLFHDHDWEPELLRSAVQSPARFIGCLGSRRTHNGRLALLGTYGVSDADLARIRGPIGMVPSLREAPLIAISAMAEIVGALPSGIRPAA